MNKTGFIYQITSPTNMIYIGQTINIEKRIRAYKKGRSIGQKILNASINKHGFDSHDFMIMDEVPFDKLNDAEQFYISICKSFHGENIKGMNLTIGGGGTRGHIVGDEAKQKLRDINLGKKQSKEACEKKRIASTGRLHTDDAKQKISKWHKDNSPTRGKELSEDHRKKISKSNKGRGVSEKSLNRLSEYNKTREFSEETRKKMSDAAKLRMSNPKYAKNISDKVRGQKRTKNQKYEMSIRAKGRITSEETKIKISEQKTKWWAEKRAKKLLENE